MAMKALLDAPADEAALIAGWLATPVMDGECRRQASALAEKIVQSAPAHESLADELMQTYPLNSREGIALMSLAEAMLRVPDADTRDALIYDKIPGRHWTVDGGSGRVRLTGAAMAALGNTLEGEKSAALSAAVARLGMPLIRQVVRHAMKLFGGQFVMAETIAQALQRAPSREDLLYSFDMLGEGARDEDTAARYLASYEQAINHTAAVAQSSGTHANNGVSVKLSALYPRYETRQRKAVRAVLLPRILQLAQLAKRGNIPLTLDAEEMARLPLLLDMVAALMAAPALQGYNGLGVAVQAYGLRTAAVLDALLAMAQAGGRTLAIRLTKGAYWDSEIKIAQKKGLADFPVFTRKLHTDLAYLHHAHRLLHAGAAIYPQFASHNAATLAAIQVMAAQRGDGGRLFEVQQLYGMGNTHHAEFQRRFSHRRRVYAPVGSHDDLLAYLVRRLLENAANSSFIHRLHEKTHPLSELVAHPYDQLAGADAGSGAAIRTGSDLFLPQRANSRGYDLESPQTLAALQKARRAHRHKQYVDDGGAHIPSPANPHDRLRVPADTAPDAVAAALVTARAHNEWRRLSGGQRAAVLRRIAAVYEENDSEIFALLAREAGKTIEDAVDELREAVDFCLYYSAALPAQAEARGVVLAISPWNFPLAIFTGQIVAALAAGNTVVAKPAEQTPLIALLAVRLMQRAGVPQGALQLVFGKGETTGAALVASGEADMVVFTGSTETARAIHRGIAACARPAAPLLAETGGINAMLVDSTALPEQAVDDIITSAFRSAGQRCSALRMLYVQDDIAETLLAMLIGAAEQLKIGDPGAIHTDIGPVIDAAAQHDINATLQAQRQHILWRAPAPVGAGSFVAPAILRVDSIAEIKRELFGPVLHVASYSSADFERVLGDINRLGYGLTFGLHSRMETRQRLAADVVTAGNVYINRNQVGAVVGSQPFGGCGLSGTGPKAGGALYLQAFMRNRAAPADTKPQLLPGPDGEENRYCCLPRGRVLCLAASAAAARELLAAAEQAGNSAQWAAALPDDLSAVQAVMVAPDADIAAVRRRLAEWEGILIPLIGDDGARVWLQREKHISNDTTALGGNVSLLAVSG